MHFYEGNPINLHYPLCINAVNGVKAKDQTKSTVPVEISDVHQGQKIVGIKAKNQKINPLLQCLGRFQYTVDVIVSICCCSFFCLLFVCLLMQCRYAIRYSC